MKQMIIKFLERFALNNLISGNYDKSYKYFKKIHSYDSNRKGILYNIGLSLMGMKRYDEAADYLKNEIKIFGESGACLSLLGDISYMDGNRKDANMYYSKCAEYLSVKEKNLLKIKIKNTSTDKLFENAKHAQSLFDEAVEFEKKKDFVSAKKKYIEAIEFDRNHFLSLNNLGALILNIEDDKERAHKYFQKAYEINSLPSIKQNLKKTELLIKGK